MMANTIISIPITVEQLAFAVQHLSLPEQRRLVELVPTLRRAVTSPLRTQEQAQLSVAALRQEMQALPSLTITDETPFIGELSWGDYQALDEEQRNNLWGNSESDAAWNFDEVEVPPNALSAR